LQLSSVDHLLARDLLLVERREVVDDDWNGQRDDQHSADAATSADQLSPAGPRTLVAVAYGRHGDGGPPERARDAREVAVRLVLLGEVNETREDQNLDGEEHHQQTELLVAALERVSERLQSGGVSCQLQHAKYPQDAQQLHEAS